MLSKERQGFVMEKSRKKFNIVDLVVVAVIIIALAYAAYAVVSNMEENSGTAQIQYVIEVAEIRSELADNIAEGDAVYNADGDFMGNVSSISVSQAYHEGADKNGNAVYSRIDGYNALYITVDCTAGVRNAGYEISDEYIAAGNEYALRAPGLYFNGECVSVKDQTDK